jgi:hypothetical protein
MLMKLSQKYETQNFKLNGRDLLGQLDIDGRAVLKWILRKQNMKVWTGFIWHRTCGGLL